jgi:hypothetical protein
VLDRIASTCAAVITRGPATIREANLGESVSPVLPKEIFMEASTEMIPGKDLVFSAMAIGEPLRVEAMRSHC